MTDGRATVDSAELRTMQQPLKDAYREHPEQAVITLQARGQLEDQAISCSVATGQALTNAGGRWYVVDAAGHAVITK